MNCTLNSKEIMCIAAGLGATELYGIPDGFSGSSKATLNREILEVQSSLEKKGYLAENFDGEASLNTMVAEIVNVCANCEKFIAVDKQLKRKMQEGVIYYIKGSDAVKLLKVEEEYKLEQMDASLITPDIKKLFVWSDAKENISTDFIISNKQLTKAKTLKKRNADEAAQKILTDIGVCEKTAKIIINGLNADENFYSITVADLTADNDNVQNVMFINSSEASFKMVTLVENDEDVIRFTNIDYKDAIKELNEMIKKVDIVGEVFE